MTLFIWDDDLRWLEGQGASANLDVPSPQEDLRKFIHFPVREGGGSETRSDLDIVAPNTKRLVALLPGSVVDHEQIFFDDVSVRIIVEQACRPIFGSILIYSAIPEVSGRVTAPLFSYNYFYRLYHGNETTPFAVLSNCGKHCFVWNFDLQYSFIASQDPKLFAGTAFDDQTKWNLMFESTMAGIVPASFRTHKLLKKWVIPR